MGTFIVRQAPLKNPCAAPRALPCGGGGAQGAAAMANIHDAALMGDVAALRECVRRGESPNELQVCARRAPSFALLYAWAAPLAPQR
jgi:hypothetical protein